MNFLEMLLISRKITFVDGKITLYNQNFSIYPPQAMAEYIGQSNDDPKLVKLLYSVSKEGMLENKQWLIKVYDVNKKADWICDLINLYGLGKISYENPNNTPFGILFLENSSIAQELNENLARAKYSVDHIVRGLIAGVCSAVSNSDVDVIETQCSVATRDKCKLLVDTKENLKNNFPKIFKEQIG